MATKALFCLFLFWSCVQFVQNFLLCLQQSLFLRFICSYFGKHFIVFFFSNSYRIKEGTYDHTPSITGKFFKKYQGKRNKCTFVWSYPVILFCNRDMTLIGLSIFLQLIIVWMTSCVCFTGNIICHFSQRR